MDTELWDCVASEATNDIEGGGWKSSYTGEYMSEQEMSEYSENVLTKLQPYIKGESKVLEVGCASGITTKMVYPMVKHYVATDLSKMMVDRLQNAYHGDTNIEFHCVPANKINEVVRGVKFDVIIMNSVAHCFPSHNYMRTVISLFKELLSDEGVIFIGDVMDLDLKDKLVESLRSFKESHPQMRVKTEWHNELFLSRNFLQHVCQSILPVMEVTFSKKVHKTPNELTDFRFDAIFRKPTRSQVKTAAEPLDTHNVYIASDIEEETGPLQSNISNWCTDIDLTDEAYVLYTSGTTGLPKGVIIRHGSLLNYSLWACKTYKFDGSTCVPLFSPLTFDFTITSIFPPLLSGSSIRIFDRFRESFQEIASCTDLTLVKFSPIQLDTILSDVTKPLSASTFILGGEELTSNLLLKLKRNKSNDDFVVWNEYGPTEATVGCVVKEFKSDTIPLEKSELVPIGKPIDNVTIAVLGNNSKPVPLGANGRLGIGGSSLCFGYTGRSSCSTLKAACWGRPGSRMLVTDDVVEMTPSTKDVLYFGRKDSDCCKVNGIRIDCIEIEQALEASAIVESAWVATFGYKAKTYLGAALKLKADNPAHQPESHWKTKLTSSISHTIPATSIPHVYVPVTDPPTNTNGKKDNGLLKTIFADRMKQKRPSERVTEEEMSQDRVLSSKMQEIWHGILPIDNLPGVRDHFFYDLSGDSLQAIHLTRKLRAEGFHVSVTDIFQNPTIESLLATMVKRSSIPVQVEAAVMYRDVKEEQSGFKPTPILEDFINRPLVCRDRFSLSALLKFHSSLDKTTLKKALRSVMTKHGSLRSCFEVVDGQATQRVLPLPPNEPEVLEVDISSKSDSLTKESEFADTCHELEQHHSLSEGIILTSALIRFYGTNCRHEVNPDCYVLLAVHHAAIDIVSWQQILEDLALALRLLTGNDNTEPGLPPCLTSFQRYCNILHREANESFARDIPYWTAVGNDCQGAGRLGIADDSPGTFGTVKWTNKSLDAQVLRSISSKLGCSDEHVLLTVFGRALSAIHGRDKTAICLESHGRQLESVDTTDTVGWCTSIFPFVINTSATETMVEQVKSIERDVKKIPLRGLSFGILRSAGKLDIPDPKIIFVFQGSLDASSKTTFEGGNFDFDHVPWLEVMNDELKEDRFHRHPDELLEFHLEIIIWLHGGKLQMGCLVDESKIHLEDAEMLLTNASRMINAMFTKVHHIPREISVAVVPAFNVTPECIATMTDALTHHDIKLRNVAVYPSDQLTQSLYKALQSEANITVIIPRFSAIQQAEEFVEILKKANEEKNEQEIVVLNTKLPNTVLPDSHSLMEADVGVHTHNSIAANQYDNAADERYQMPFTPAGYTYFGLSIARTINRLMNVRRYKAIAVDADYTLWEGECAQGDVTIEAHNKILQKFLVEQKERGILLVCLSKNNANDVESVFAKQNGEMMLKYGDFVAVVANWEQKSVNINRVAKMLNISLDSFVFIDDNALECEAMLKGCPSVLTLQLPSGKNSGLVLPFVENMWSLEFSRTTNEAKGRTVMYRNEFSRQEELNAVENSTKYAGELTKLLQGWNMKLDVCKTTVATVKQHKVIYDRVAELLQRTNQFKLNDTYTDLDKVSSESQCWLIASKDRHGSYGIVGICLLEDLMTLTQWVVSCRALGRYVEHRILMELFREKQQHNDGCTLRLALCKTNRNTPMLKFLAAHGLNENDVLQQVQHVHIRCPSSNQCDSKLHRVEFKTHTEFIRTWCPKVEKVADVSHNIPESPLSSVNDLVTWIESTWSVSQKQQGFFHNLYPILPQCSDLQRIRQHMDTADKTTQRAEVLRRVWMEVLRCENGPDELSNFLESGGNSFKAGFLVSELRRTCNIDINITDVLRNPMYEQVKRVVLQAHVIKDLAEPDSSLLLRSLPSSYPVTSAQMRMILMQQTSPTSTAYVETLACRASGRFDPLKILEGLVKKHPILTSIIQISNEKETYSMTTTRRVPEKIESETLEGSHNLEEYVKQSIPVIGIIACPLYKFRHITITKDDHLFVLHVHHVLVDDISLQMMLEDLQDVIMGRESSNRSSPSQHHFSDYVNDENTYNTSANHEADKEFWDANISTLPGDSNIAIQQTSGNALSDAVVYEAKETSSEIGPASASEIKRYCKSIGATEFHYFLACTSLVLQRYFGVDDFFMAVPVTTREYQFAEVDGMFINTVLFRARVKKNQTMTEYVSYIRNEWLKTQSHSRYPLDQVTQSLWKAHGRSMYSLCSVLFNYTTQSRPNNALRIGSQHAKMPLSIDVVSNPESNTYDVISEFADNLIDGGIVERLSHAVLQLCCEGFKINEELSRVEILSPLELQLLQSFSTNTDNATSCHQFVPVHREFENHALEDASTTAIFCEERLISYGELHTMSTKIATFLHHNLSMEDLRRKPVVMALKKNQYAIACILGVWKAGGHFLPVSLSNEACLKDIFEREVPAALIFDTHSTTIQTLSPSSPMWTIEDMLESCDEKGQTEEENFKTVVEGEATAYIIRTSGSTGKPKQCRISHRGLRTIAEAWKVKYSMHSYDVHVLQWAPLSFDVFIGDVVRALVCVQGKLVICPDSRRLEIPHILGLIRDQHVTMVETTPQFGFQLVEHAKQSDIQTIKVFILGSDVLQEHLYNQIKRRLTSDQRLINSYGMTEATIDSSCFEGVEIPKTRSGTVPIGKPLPGVTMHVFDSKTLQPCPIGTVGELYISGDILATGDANVVQVNSINALKTGDSACWLPTGDIELMGRLDDMVKLRGFRISTTEIENKILKLVAGVKEAHVTTMPDKNTDGTEFLCAYIALDADTPQSNSVIYRQVRNKLRIEIPYYMIPDKIQIIPEVPLTSNGKVNKKALSQYLTSSTVLADQRRKSTSGSNSAIATTLQECLAEAMGLQDQRLIQTDATFMEQGAHSLVLVRFWSLMTKRSIKVEVTDLFSYPTICSLTEYIESKERDELKVHEYPQTSIPREITDNFDGDIAITGIGMRLPEGISSLAEFWSVLKNGSDVIKEFPQQRRQDVMSCIGQANARALEKGDTFQGAFLSNIDRFDHDFFKIAPGEAKFMSPEQRLFLQVATEALAEGTSLSAIRGSNVGVFVGCSEVGYAKLQHPDTAICVSGLMPGMIATRVAYQWDLKGPTMLIDTACSSSLIALKQACEAIKKNECSGALVGGVNLVLYPSRTGVFGQSSILSPDYHCKAFDENATGTAVGEGVMCLYIEPLQKALQEGKSVYGIVKGMASNSVGHGNGITAPSSTSQVKVIKDALAAAHLSPSNVTFVEGHGTGTKLGDRIELSALSSVFADRRNVSPLPVGAVKSIFGHLDSAAGLLGVLKVLACMAFESISPTANFKSPHPELLEGNICVPSTPTEWKTGDRGVRVAGVSSYGLTGTNCHAILTDYRSSETQVEASDEANASSYPLIFIGETVQQICQQAHLHRRYIEEKQSHVRGRVLPGLCLAVAKQLQEYQKVRGTRSYYRMVINAKTVEQVLKLLEMITANEDTTFVIRLAKMRSDIHFRNSVKEPNTDVLENIQQFLHNGTVDIESLFCGRQRYITPALGVNVSIFQESRHWLDEQPSRGLEVTRDADLFELFQEKLNKVREMVRTLPLSPTKDLEDVQGQFCAAIIINLFMTTGLAQALQTNKEMSFDEAFNLTGMLKKFKKLFFVMVRELAKNGLLEAIGFDVSVSFFDVIKFKCEDALDMNAEVIGTAAIKKYPAWADCFRFPLYCSKYLRKVLWGNMSPLSVIYPQGDLNFMYQFDKLGDLLGDVYYNMYMQLIAEYAQHLSRRGEKVRILEVGAGVGHVTRQLLPKLKDTPNVEYWFTDLGKAFVDHARTMFSEYSNMMQFSTFDITKSAPKQGVFGSFDIVISYNVIHTTQSIEKSVHNLKTCLGEDGTLFIIESARNDTWATLAWGILDGWWFFEDYHIRSADPMLEPDKWEQVLSKAGFSSVYSCPQDAAERQHVEKFLFLCSQRSSKSQGYNNQLGWWETDANRFDPIRKFDELEENDTNKDSETQPISVVNDRRIFEELRNIWRELLGIDEINPDDDFNALGGESLLAIQMMNFVRKRIGYQLEIADTFGYPTLNALAMYIADQVQGESKDDFASEFDKTANVTGPRNFTHNNQCSTPEDLKTKVAPAEARQPNGTLLMFPGQGAQKRGMCISMKNSAEAKAIFVRAKEVLGYDLLDILLRNDDTLAQKLKSTEFVQVALLVSCIAKVEQLKKERPDLIARVTHVAGLSVGEFAALVFAGVVTFEEALYLVQERGRAMELEVQRSPTGMVSVFGIGCEVLQKYLETNFPEMQISTYLADNQHTIAGREQECEALTESLKRDFSGEVVDVRKLRVAGAFHSRYMSDASQVIDPIINGIEFQSPTLPVIMNANGIIVQDPQQMKRFLREQLVKPVQWKRAVVTAYEEGVRDFVEVAPARVLSSIVKNRIAEVEKCNAELVTV